MRLICQRAFGNFEPGDTVEVPDGSEFDGFHFLVDDDGDDDGDTEEDSGKEGSE